MKREDYDHAGRSMRWYEWLVCLLVLLLASGARAATVYRCVDAHGATAFQDIPCAPGDVVQTVTIATAPADPPAQPHAVVERVGPTGGHTTSRRGGEAAGRRREPLVAGSKSYECRSVDGQVFYRHSACPHTIEAKQDGFGRSRAEKQKVAVRALRVSRDEACMQMRRAGASGRTGHTHDEDVSTDEKNLGHDPCR